MMNVKEYLRRYKNVELCAKWDNNIPASELEFPLMFLTSRQDIDSLCEYFPFLPSQDVTGALVTIHNGDYGEVYITESSNPYMSRAVYHPLDYYFEGES